MAESFIFLLFSTFEIIGMFLFLAVLLVFLLVTYFPVWYCKCGERVCKEGRSFDEIEYEQLMVEEAKLQIMEKTQEKRSQAIKTLLDQEMQGPSQVGGSNVWDKTAITELKPLLQDAVKWVKNKLAPPKNDEDISMKKIEWQSNDVKYSENDSPPLLSSPNND
ncbi:hypothetical protein NDU88_002204 [Pleurodeles waltl]|uniref:Uncharacterized protein n=1 Tax=Pleurodeles waltl TaxID=8319 RepID=A0AAV7Q619_PLEWA|nr:hypothetical protein NDU88_002204 [Pleurodeles waltl]